MKITPTQTALGGNNNLQNKKWCGDKARTGVASTEAATSSRNMKRKVEATSKARYDDIIPIGLLTKYP